jgi:hypothetical protein
LLFPQNKLKLELGKAPRQSGTELFFRPAQAGAVLFDMGFWKNPSAIGRRMNIDVYTFQLIPKS